MSRLRRHWRWVLAAAVAATVATPAAAAAAPAERQRSTQGIEWDACTDPVFAGKQCGTMRVPVDWSRPRGAHLTLALVRQPALDPAHRIGTLLINNGRGLSAIEQFRYALEGLTQIGGAMPQRFDLLAVDTRGAGHSTPIRCAEPLKPAGISYFPESKAAFDKLVAHNRTLGRDCVRRNGSLVAHMDQAGTARDLDAVRVALGERQLDWYGIKYSDLLGRTYAKLFPGRLRTMVLDTAVDDTVSPADRALQEAGAAEDAFNRFAERCSTSQDCALRGQDAAARYDALVSRANRRPIPAGAVRHPMTGEDIQEATQPLLPVVQIGWPRLAAAILQAEAGDATLFAASGDRTALAPVHARACADDPRRIRSFGQLSRVQRRLVERSPHLGGAVSSAIALSGCIGWPVPPKPVDAGKPVSGAPPALIVQSTHQVFAPHAAGYAMARQLPGSVVLSREGDDYSMFAISQCVRDTTNRYLTERALPAQNTICTD
ncbi:alpha/beta fold hydrolase [Sphaerisporangium sp. TRM90804]|uniref:alpha/beta fold hydrolase n=1 Tax=Sphaerisporangium sp. TRM90804 TaxID=3031113 RepID=UPI00244B84AE|nr:alpha/beta fold hydrolase [Sphaerisporangium sp. TRM90804]MDH2428435.1 alpha/beta fold hydrolase [Sphaerisporangium sp. TRM90804]